MSALALANAYADCPARGPGARALQLQEQRQLLAFAALVKPVVNQLRAQASAVLDRSDMEQIGLLALLEALRRYGEPDAAFPAYANQRVRGAILDELRRLDWRPRTVRQHNHKLRDAVRALTRQLGRLPSEQDIQDRLGLTPEQYDSFRNDENASVLARFDDILLDTVAAPQHAEGQFVMRRSLERALCRLTQRERHLVQMYYEFELSYEEIGAVLGLTRARVCQLNRMALDKMRTVLLLQRATPQP